MRCPSETAEIITGILRTGLLHIRALGFNGAAERCAIEADHLHNLPSLLMDYDPKLLDYYWRVERIAYIKHSSREDAAGFEALWIALGEHIGSATDMPVSAQ
jgi:hypothetical protein